MAASNLVDLVKIQVITLGTGALGLGQPVAMFRGLGALIDGGTYSYSIQHNGDYEYGQGVYSAGGATLTRSPIASSNGNAAIFLTAGAAVTFTALAADLERAALGNGLLSAANLSDVASVPAAVANLGLDRALVRPVACFFTTTPTVSEVLALYTAIETITFADDFAGSICAVGANPTSSFVLAVARNGVAVGSITVATGGAIVFATIAGALVLVAGDVLRITAPAVADVTIANVAITLKGSLA